MSGILRGFDPYMNIVIDDTIEERSSTQKVNIGMVVSATYEIGAHGDYSDLFIYFTGSPWQQHYPD